MRLYRYAAISRSNIVYSQCCRPDSERGLYCFGNILNHLDRGDDLSVLIFDRRRDNPEIDNFISVGSLRYRFMDLTVAAWAVDFIAVGVRDLLPLITSTPPAGH